MRGIRAVHLIHALKLLTSDSSPTAGHITEQVGARLDRFTASMLIHSTAVYHLHIFSYMISEREDLSAEQRYVLLCLVRFKFYCFQGND